MSILNGGDFEFPEKKELNKKLKDVLDEEVDDCYYLSDAQTARLKTATFNCSKYETRVQSGDTARTLCARDYKDPKCIQVAQIYGEGKEPNPQAGRVYDSDGISPTMDTCSGGNRMPKIVAQRGRADGDWHSSEHYQRLEPREDGLTNTISSVVKDNYVAEPAMKIRKLTEKECWRLMGFDDFDCDKAKAVGVSKSQLYKQAGNSIVVNVLEGILRNLLTTK